MLLNLRSLQGAHEHIENQYEPALFATSEHEPYRIVAPVSLAFDVHRQEAGRYRVIGELTTTIELNCSRCIDLFRMPLQTKFELQYVPRIENTGEDEREIAEDDLTTAFYSNEQIDLGQLIAEQIQLALPMKPLCRQECRGLCPQCGTNLNIGTCDCNPTWQDPRLAALESFKK